MLPQFVAQRTCTIAAININLKHTQNTFSALHTCGSKIYLRYNKNFIKNRTYKSATQLEMIVAIQPGTQILKRLYVQDDG